jgi:putative ABC transport system permease protein
MLRLTLKNIWAYKTRLALSILSIVLGVAFLCGTLVFSATVKGAFDDLFASVYKNTDAAVRSDQTRPTDDGFGTVRETVPRSLIEQVESVDGVKSVSGFVDNPNIVVIGEDGKRVFTLNGPPTFGFNQPTNPDLALFRVVGEDGDSLSVDETVNTKLADNEIFVDKASAEIKNIKVGDPLKVVLPQEVREYKVKAFVRFGTADGIGGPAVFLFNEKQAQDILGKGDTFSSIQVAAEDGVSQEEVQSTIAQFLEKEGIENTEVVTGEELTKEDQDQIKQFLNFFTIVLLAFAVVSFIVALVIIVNSFAIVLAQRKREYALLRAVGSKASQIRWSVFLESLFVGLFASAIGVVAGIGLAFGITELLRAIDVQLPAGGLIVQPSTVMIGIIVGTLASVGAAFIPAWISSRVPPIEALRDSAIEKNRGWKWRILLVALLAIVTSLMIFSAYAGEEDDRLRPMATGLFLLFVLVVVALPLLVRPFTAVVGSRPAGVLLILFGGRRAFGVTGDIARRNNYRNPRRTSRTALALFIGVFLAVFITVLATSITAQFNQYFDENFSGDLVIGDFGTTTTLTNERCAEIDAQDFVAASTCFTSADVKVPKTTQSSFFLDDGETLIISAANSSQIPGIFSTDYEGEVAALGDDGAFTHKRYAEDNDVKIGDTLVLEGSLGQQLFTIKGIMEEELIVGGAFTIDYAGLNKIEGEKSALISIVTIKDGVDVDDAVAATEEILADTGIEVTDQKSLRDQQIGQLNVLVNFFYAMLGLAILIAGIGILNTMSLSILERHRELGLMRAIGTTKAQVRGFVRFESVIIAILGTSVGILTGIASSYLLIQALKSEGFTAFEVDPTRLIVILVLSAILGVVAGAWPAWRATKVDVLKAVTVE